MHPYASLSYLQPTNSLGTAVSKLFVTDDSLELPSLSYLQPTNSLEQLPSLSYLQPATSLELPSLSFLQPTNSLELSLSYLKPTNSLELPPLAIFNRSSHGGRKDAPEAGSLRRHNGGRRCLACYRSSHGGL